jgi:phosphoglycolate phosphatase-like HAD superfamily hydrolase
MIKTVHIFDMDGTIVNSEHRYRLGEDGKIDLAHWIENCKPEMIEKDTLLPHAALYKALLIDPTAYVVIATARYMTNADFEFVDENLGMPNKFVYRHAENTHMKGADIKIAGLRFLNNLKQFKNAIRYFYEDNKEYLFPVAQTIKAQAIFVPSEQGF